MKNLAIAAILAAGVLAAWAPDALADDASASSLWNSLRQQDEPKPAAPAEAAGEPMSDPIDLEHVEAEALVGVLVFGSDFDSDPKVAGSLLIRAPMPWLSRDVVGLETDEFGVFLQVTLSSIDRDTDPEAEEPDGIVFLAAVGIDYTLYRDEEFMALAQVGVQYAYFGDVTETDSGVGLLLGLEGGMIVEEGIRITLAPQLGIGEGGDILFFAQIGVNVAF